MKFLACLLLFTLPIFNIASAQYITPQKKMSDVSSSEDYLLMAYGLFSFYSNNWKPMKEDCLYKYRFGAPAITQTTIQVLEETTPEILRSIDKCHQQKYGKPINRVNAQKRFSEQAGGIDIAFSTLNNVPITAPKRTSELTNCNNYGQLVSQSIVVFQNDVSYPRPQWCEKLK